MKKIASLITVLLIAMTVSCSKDDNNNTTNDELYLRFTTNGTAYDIADPETLTSLSTAIDAQQGADASMRRVTLFIPNDATVGTHDITDEPSNVDAYGAVYYQGNDITVAGTSGTLTITSKDADYVKGTFTFSGVDGTTGDPYTVTIGSFRAMVN